MSKTESEGHSNGSKTGCIAGNRTERDVPPPADFSSRAYITNLEEYQKRYQESIQDTEGFWSRVAEGFHWYRKWDRVRSFNYDLNQGSISIRWFEGARSNITYNCVDRHLETRGDQVAIIWEGNEPGEDARLTYRELHEQVCKCANILKSRGVKKGDRVSIYMPMIPSWPSRCWPVPASGRFTASSSAASRPIRWPTGSWTRPARCS